MNRLLLIFVFLLAAFSSGVNAASASSAQAFDECKEKVMSASGEELLTIKKNEIVDACQSFPLSDDVFVQVLGGVIGPNMITLLDVYTVLTGNEHGFEPDSQIFLIAEPLHEVLLSFNLFFMSLLLFLLFLGLVTQMLRWQKGESGEGAKEWFGKHGPNNGLTILLSMPVIGWMTPLQAIAVMFIIMVGYVAKWAVTYLFLASFFSSTGASIKDEVAEDLEINYGRTIMLYQCDLERREYLISAVQASINSREKSALSSDSIYQCLTSSSSVQPTLSQIASSKGATYKMVPSTLVQTQNCIRDNRETLKDLGVEEPEQCGFIQFDLPDNTAVPNSINNAISLYANSSISVSQRDLALKAHEYECRIDGIPTYDGAVVDSCLNAVRSGDGYDYRYLKDSVTGNDELSYFKTRLTQTTREVFSSEVKKELRNLNTQVSNNTSAMLAHLVDLLAPEVDEQDIPSVTQDRRDGLAERLKSEFSETGTLGVSESDVNHLVNNIKRGAWTSSSLFFGSLTESLEESGVVTSLRGVYSVPSGFLDGVTNSKLLILREMQNGGFDSTFSGDTKLSSMIIPRLGLYLDNVDCWFEQFDCKSTSLNPFTELGSRGAALVEQSMSGYLGTKVLQMGTQKLMGFSSNKKYSRFMILDTLGEFQWLYLLMGLIIAILIPLIPFLKLLTMMINWVIDIVRELASLQFKICISPMSDHGGQFVSEDVRESLSRLVGLGLYFLFVIIGLMVMFVMFSFLFSINVFLIGILSSSVTWGVSINSIDEVLMNMIFDIIIVILMLYQVKKCSSYIEKVPKEMAQHFKIKISPSEGPIEQMIMYIRNNVAPGVSNMLHNIGKR